jgi:ribosome-associated protein
VIVIKAQQYRSLERNRTAALERLRSLILKAMEKPKPRKPTRPTKAAERRRLEEKAHRAKLKRRRARVPDE